jgi:hypothetical protein
MKTSWAALHNIADTICHIWKHLVYTLGEYS